MFDRTLSIRSNNRSTIKYLVLADKQDAHETIPLLEINRGWGVSGLHADNTGLDLGWGTEVVLADLHDMLNLGKELDVNTKTTVQRIAGLGNKAKSEFTLEHEN